MRKAAFLCAAMMLALIPLMARADAAEDRELEALRQQDIDAALARARHNYCEVPTALIDPLKPGMLLLRVFIERKKSGPIVVKDELETRAEINSARVLNVIVGNVAPDTLIEIPTTWAYHPTANISSPYVTDLKQYLVALSRKRGRYVLEQVYPCRDS
jgi:hypothetical protein